MPRLVAAWLVVFIWAALYLPGLGRPELKGEEGRRILPGLTMLDKGRWILPEMEGQPYLRKPPLINWVIAASTQVYGKRHEWAARTPSALAVLALALGGLFLGGRLLAGPGATEAEKTRGGGILAGMLLTTAGLWTFGRSAEIESLYVCLTGLALLVWAHAWVRGASHWQLWGLPSFFLALGMLAKGPAHLFFFYLLALGVLWQDEKAQAAPEGSASGRATRQAFIRHLLRPGFWLGLALTLLPFIGWSWMAKRAYALTPGQAAAATRQNSAGETWFTQIAERFEWDLFDLGSWAQVPFESVLHAFPWVLLLLLGWKKALPTVIDKLQGKEASLIRGWRWGIVVAAIAFWCIPTVRSRFLGPLLTPLMVLCGLPLLHAWEGRARDLWIKVSTALLVVVSVTAVILPWVLLSRHSITDRLWAGAATVIATVAVGRLWIKTLKLHPAWRLVLTLASTLAVASAVAATTIFPSWDSTDRTRPLGRSIESTLPADSGTVGLFNPGVVPPPLHWRFYLKTPCHYFTKLSELPKDTRYVLTVTAYRQDPTKAAHAVSHEKELAGKLKASRGFRPTGDEWTDPLKNTIKLYTTDSPADDAEEARPLRLPRKQSATDK